MRRDEIVHGRANFIIVDTLATYNTIFRKPLLNMFQIMILTYHVTIKISIDDIEITIKRNMYLMVIVVPRKEDEVL